MSGTHEIGLTRRPSDVKNDHQHVENSDDKLVRELRGDASTSDVGAGDSEAVIVSEEDNKRILRKTDMVILVIICWVYFLQILDKSVIGYSAVFGLQKDTHLEGNQYSFVGSIGYIAQLAWQPFSMLLVIKVSPRTLTPVLVFCWGASLTGMAGVHNYHGLLATRFLLGLFEAACLPLFTLLVSNWYRRAEQPLRIAAFYSTNGIATILGSAMVYGLGHIKSSSLHSYQIIFLIFGLITVISAPPIWWKLDNSVATARFLSPDDRIKGVERLRANQGVQKNASGTSEFKWKQVVECFLEPKTWLFFGMSLLLNIGASVSNVFGPLILSGLGFDPYMTSLLNMPFGFLQFVVILISSWCAYNFKVKGVVLAALMLPVVAGCGMLYGLGRTKAEQPALLAAYYMIAFLFAGNPLLLSWIAGNTAGQTKKSTILALYQCASSAGNITGPYLFKSKDKPYYKPGVKAVLGCFIALVALVILQIINLMTLNKLKERQRVAHGKPAKLRDLSMTHHFAQATVAGEDVGGVSGSDVEAGNEANGKSTTIGALAFADLTDWENDEFQYIL